jgi:hypothetical protein
MGNIMLERKDLNKRNERLLFLQVEAERLTRQILAVNPKCEKNEVMRIVSLLLQKDNI